MSQKRIDRAQVMRLYGEGLRATDVARAVGADRAMVAQIIRDHGGSPAARMAAKCIDLNVVRSLVELGLSQPAIAAELGVNEDAVRAAVKRAGLSRPAPPPPLDAVERREARRMRDSGMSVRAIARAFGRGSRAIRTALRPPRRARIPRQMLIAIHMRAAILDMAAAGATSAEIVARLRISESVVRRLRRASEYPPRWNHVDAGRALVLRAEGVRPAAVARLLGCSVSRVMSISRERGVGRGALGRKAEALLLDGMPVSEISRLLDADPDAITSALRQRAAFRAKREGSAMMAARP
ncbi:hypothetical protein D3877_29130 [Azospirillum cavernae]|uniref:Helix-turn-helix domain-containing protein n=1 Tax=Azospirillum cavernae TaxID=2320860 RepID=A0A418VJY6_9PROT|nr:hypothetical protein [Azospirillum cavernae]RJF76450.1 hypothetical protein D3877_29130 [Azospirillum cavernae]